MQLYIFKITKLNIDKIRNLNIDKIRKLNKNCNKLQKINKY